MDSKSGGNLTDDNQRQPVILLPFYLHAQIPPVFTHLGFRCLHMEWFPLKPSASEFVKQFFDDPVTSRANMQEWQSGVIEQYVKWAKSEPIDAALEWQHGRKDFPLLTLRRTAGKTWPIYLFLNWNGEPPENWRELGYAGLLEVPFSIESLEELRVKISQGT